MKGTQDQLSIGNMYDPIIKVIKGLYNTNSPTKEQARKYKRFEKEVINSEKKLYACKHLALPILMGCTKPKGIDFRTELGFNQLDLIMTTEHS